MLFIDDILLSPFAGFSFIMRTILKMAEEEYTDDAPLKEQLLNLQVQLESGELTEEQYIEAEAAILKALREVQRRKIELAGGDPDAMAGGCRNSFLSRSAFPNGAHVGSVGRP